MSNDVELDEKRTLSSRNLKGKGDDLTVDVVVEDNFNTKRRRFTSRVQINTDSVLAESQAADEELEVEDEDKLKWNKYGAQLMKDIEDGDYDGYEQDMAQLKKIAELARQKQGEGKKGAEQDTFQFSLDTEKDNAFKFHQINDEDYKRTPLEAAVKKYIDVEEDIEYQKKRSWGNSEEEKKEREDKLSTYRRIIDDMLDKDKTWYSRAKLLETGNTIELMVEGGLMTFLYDVDTILQEREKELLKKNKYVDTSVCLWDRLSSYRPYLSTAVYKGKFEVASWLFRRQKCNPLLGGVDNCAVIECAKLAYPITRKKEGPKPSMSEEEKERELAELIEAKKLQKEYQSFYEELIADLHPFAALKKSRWDDEITPLILAIYKVSPGAVDVLVAKFEDGSGFDGEANTYDDYNFSCRSDKWYQFMISKQAKSAILQVLDADISYILRQKPIQVMMKSFWDHCVRRVVIFEMIIFISLLISSSLLINLGVLDRSKIAKPLEIICYILTIYVIVNTGVLIYFEIMHIYFQRRRYFRASEWWNFADWISYGIVLYCSVVLLSGHIWNAVERQLMAVALIYLWMKLLEYGGSFQTVSTISRLFLMMLRTLIQYLAVILLFVIAFGHAMYLSLVVSSDPAKISADDGFSNVFLSIFRMYRALMGDTLPFDTLYATSPLAVILYLAFTVTGLLLLLNLLIALMTKVFDEVKENIEIDFLSSRAEVLSKKMRVYLLSELNSRIFFFLNPRLTKLHIEEDDKEKLAIENTKSEANENNQQKQEFFQSKWKTIVRVSLFIPTEWYRKGEDTTVRDIKPIQYLNDAAQHWVDINDQLTTLRLNLNERLSKVETTQGKMQQDLTDVRTTTFLTTSLTTNQHKNKFVRKNAVELVSRLEFKEKPFSWGDEEVEDTDATPREISTLLLAQALNDDDLEVVKKALKTVSKLKLVEDEQIAEGATKLLKCGDKDTAVEAAKLLGQFYQEGIREKIKQPLLDCLNSAEEDVVEAATLALIAHRIRDARMKPSVLAIIKKDADEHNVAHALTAVVYCRFRDQETVELLLDVLENTANVKTKAGISETLGGLAPYESKPIPLSDDEIDKCIKQRTCTYVVTGRLYKDQDYYTCNSCGIAESGGSLCVVCKDTCHKISPVHPSPPTDTPVTGSCFCDCGARGPGTCKAIGQINNSLTERVVDALVKVLDNYKDDIHNSADVTKLRYKASISLGQCGVKSKEVAESMFNLLGDKDAGVEQKAKDTLISLGIRDAKFAQIMVDKLEVADQDVQEDIYEVLSFLRLTDKFIVQAVLKGINKKKQANVIQAALVAMERLGLEDKELYDAVVELFKNGNTKQAALAEKALSAPLKADAKALVMYLTGLLKDDNKDLQLAAAMGLITRDFTPILLEKGICTYAFTGTSYSVEQQYMACDNEECGFSFDNFKGVCMVCAKVCHKGHKLNAETKKGFFYCDCGKEKDKCKSIKDVSAMLKEYYDPISKILCSALDDGAVNARKKPRIVDALRKLKGFTDPAIGEAVVKFVEESRLPLSNDCKENCISIVQTHLSDISQKDDFLQIVTEWLGDENESLKTSIVLMILLGASGNAKVAYSLLKVASNKKLATDYRSEVVDLVGGVGVKDEKVISGVFALALDSEDEYFFKKKVMKAISKLVPTKSENESLYRKFIIQLIECSLLWETRDESKVIVKELSDMEYVKEIVVDLCNRRTPPFTNLDALRKFTDGWSYIDTKEEKVDKIMEELQDVPENFEWD